MRNCLSYSTHTLPQFLINLGIWNILEVFDTFNVITNVLTLDQHLRTTNDPSQMKFGATRNSQGTWQNRTVEFLLNHLVRIISNPCSPEEAMKINTALKSLTIKQHGESSDFYKILSEGLHRRTLFQKLSQINELLTDEIAANSELLEMLKSRGLLNMHHLQELTSFSDWNVKVSHYLIQNVNNYYKLKVFLFVIQNWCHDRNLIELLEEISFEMELVQANKLQQKVEEDKMEKKCLIY